VSWPASGATGGEKRPSFVVKRLKTMFSLDERTDSTGAFRLTAVKPAFELAASYLNDPGNRDAASAAAWFLQDPVLADRLHAVEETARLGRGRLSVKQSSSLYGQELTMSASRIDKFYACRFLYFLQYGLNARPRKPAGFDAPTAGTFMHYVLENVARDIRDGAGFHNIGDDGIKALTHDYVSRYVSESLDGFKDKSSRFKYLFNRLASDAIFIVLDMVRELRCSDFVPLDFELEFSESGDLPAYTPSGKDVSVKIKGFVDRVDGWERDGKLYLRVVDYKTGKKTFSLSDILYGMNMQMLIYLFALCRSGAGLYGKTIVPAGVLYTPAREELVQAPRSTCQADIEAARSKKVRRSGMVLYDGDVIEAMEHGAAKNFIPVRLTKDGPSGDSLATLEQLERLSAHIDRMLLEIAGNVRKGSIQAEPYYKNQNDNACLFCDYSEACRFSEDDGDRRRFLRKLKTDDAWRQLDGEKVQ
jgi:ATP-dependent helicase/nuclease subunit B